MSEQTATIPTPETQVPAAQPITAEIVAAAVQAGLTAHNQQVASAPKEMTPEERAEYLQVFDPNQDGFLDSFVSAITNEEATPEDRLKVINHFRDGVTNQAIRGAQILVEQQVSALRNEFAPVLQASQAQRAEDMWNQFATAYPQLAEQRGLVDAVSIQLQQGGFVPKTVEEAFSRAAETAMQVIAKATGQAYVAPVANKSEANPKPRMTSTSTQQSSVVQAAPNPQIGVASFFLKRKSGN